MGSPVPGTLVTTSNNGSYGVGFQIDQLVLLSCVYPFVTTWNNLERLALKDETLTRLKKYFQLHDITWLVVV